VHGGLAPQSQVTRSRTTYYDDPVQDPTFVLSILDLKQLFGSRDGEALREDDALRANLHRINASSHQGCAC
jgi:hypothetical protein